MNKQKPMTVRTPFKPKSINKIVKQCAKQGVPCALGTRVSIVGDGDWRIAYIPETGYFFGNVRMGRKRVAIASTDSRNDRAPWMQMLRAFFHKRVEA